MANFAHSLQLSNLVQCSIYVGKIIRKVRVKVRVVERERERGGRTYSLVGVGIPAGILKS